MRNPILTSRWYGMVLGEGFNSGLQVSIFGENCISRLRIFLLDILINMFLWYREGCDRLFYREKWYIFLWKVKVCCILCKQFVVFYWFGKLDFRY